MKNGGRTTGPRFIFHSALTQGRRSVHCVKFGLFCSSIGIGKLTSVPYTGYCTLKYGPVGNTLSVGRKYCRISRRRSLRRCAVSHSQRARSLNNRFTAPPPAAALAGLRFGSTPIAGVPGAVVTSKYARLAAFARGSFKAV